MTVGAVRPSGTVTFLFTDIEGSTRRWETDPDAMRAALATHDDVLRTAVESHGGWLFKHTGDGVLAAFASASDAIAAAIEAQRALQLPVRMGIGTGEVEQRGDDYFGPALNRAARVMAVGHGGQILVAASTAALIDGIELDDLGEHRLRDLSGAHRLFQVRSNGLRTEFPPLRTLDAVPGNLPRQTTSFIGRDVEVKELIELVRAHELVTLTGVGGVGKTRLATQVAAELVPEFPDGAWLVELAPIGDPGAVPDAVATAMGITPQAGRTVTASIAEALAGRRLLIVLDNCEHVLDAAADLVQTILARTETVKVIATSREGLRVGAEHLWPVPSLDVRAGIASAAVELFIERARAVAPTFDVSDPAQVEAVAETCRRLDGIALAIELAAARMVSMSPVEVRDRLGDRFRLLSGARRGLERHQTLRQAVQWSYDLLSDEERAVLKHCSVFAGGFDLAAATHVEGSFDEYAMLDLLDSLVRKSLVTATHGTGQTRYGLLETIRQFAEDQLAVAGDVEAVRDRHAGWFAAQIVARWETWSGPGYRAAVDWVDAEFDNLRAGFRWATDRDDLAAATAIAAHTTIMLAFAFGRYEPVAWVEELLPAAAAADVVQLPRLYAAAVCCSWTGRPEVGLGYAQTAVALEADPRYEPFEPGWSGTMEQVAHTQLGQMDRVIEVAAALAAQPGFARVVGLGQLTWGLPAVGRTEEAMAIADEALDAARTHGGPLQVAFALVGYGRAFAKTDPVRALDAYRQGLAYARENRVMFIGASIARDSADLEAVHGDLREALTLFDSHITFLQGAGSIGDIFGALATLAKVFARLDRPDVAATLHGASRDHPATRYVVDLTRLIDELRSVLGTERFDECVRAGSAMEMAQAAGYARAQIRLVQSEIGRTT